MMEVLLSLYEKDTVRNMIENKVGAGIVIEDWRIEPSGLA